MKENFYAKLNERRKALSKNSVFLTKDAYTKLCCDIEEAKVKKKKIPRDYWLLKKYDIINVQNNNKLIVPLKEETENILYYVHDEELFEILLVTHSITGHGGRDRMIKELSNKYKNITRGDVELFLHLCETCQKKRRKKNIVTKEFNSCCQLNLIDNQTIPDSEYNFVLVYQDNLTKFVILRALKTNSADEVVQHLLDIFTTFGTPTVLQCDNEEEFINKMLNNLLLFWADLKITHKTSRGSIVKVKNVENTISTWMQENNSHWASGIKFIQLINNNAFHTDLKMTPYEALFGRKTTTSTSNLTKYLLSNNVDEKIS